MTDEDEVRLTLYEGARAPVNFRPDPENDTLWATHSQVADVFGCTSANVGQHLQNLYSEGGLDQAATTKKFLVVQREGGRDVRREVVHINLDAIIAVGFRVSTRSAIDFQKWARRALGQLTTKGIVVDPERLADDPATQRQLAAYLRKLRTDEKSAYAVVRDVFKESASDYNRSSPTAQAFFAMAQDKFHYAVTRQTAAQIVLERADASKANMGLTNLKGQHPTVADVTVGKNYLDADELRLLENICEQFLLFAESKAMRGQKMTMEELSFRLNTLLTANEYPVLYEYQSYQRDDANKHARSELKKYQAALKAGGGKKLPPAS